MLDKFYPMKLGQNFVKYFVHFLGNGVSRKNAFEIYCPLKLRYSEKATNFLRNIHSRFVLCLINGQIYGGDLAKFCGLLRIHELYKQGKKGQGRSYVAIVYLHRNTYGLLEYILFFFDNFSNISVNHGAYYGFVKLNP